MTGDTPALRRFIGDTKTQMTRIRGRIREKNSEKTEHLRRKYGEDEKEIELPDEIRKYENVKVFKRGTKFECDELQGPVIVDKGLVLSDGEIKLLTRGPKYAVNKNMSREEFLNEMEKCFTKVRWENMNDGESEDEEDVKVNSDEEERRDTDILERKAEIESAKTRLVFDGDTAVLDMAKMRCTDAKQNARVVLPKSMSFNKESKVEVRRAEWNREFDKFKSQPPDFPTGIPSSSRHLQTC